MADQSVLNQVVALQQQGYSDDQISSYLSQQGITPKDITDAINKSKIKAAVGGESGMEGMAPAGGMPAPAPGGAYPSYPAASPMPAAAPSPTGAPAEAGGYYPEYGGGAGMSTETITDIADQIISEKIGDVSKSLSDMSIFKETAEKQITSMDERLKNIEDKLEELRSAIIKRIGEFGEGIGEIKNEMGMMQDTFSKTLKPLMERTGTKVVTPIRTSQEETTSQAPSETAPSRSREKPSIDESL